MVEQPPPEPPIQHIEQTVLVQQSKTSTNALGVVGFIFSLIGLFFGWCFWPVALISLLGAFLSFIGMFREPRGLAIAGFIIGLLGSVVLAILIAVIGVLGVGAAGVASALPMVKGATDAGFIQTAIVEHEAANNEFPTTLDDITTLDAKFKVDYWDNPYRFTMDKVNGTFTLKSDGEDGLRGTDDDLALNP